MSIAILYIGAALCGAGAILTAVFQRKALTAGLICTGAALWYVPLLIFSIGTMTPQRLLLVMATFTAYSALTLIASVVGARKKEALPLSLTYLAGIVGVTLSAPFMALLALTIL